MTSYITAWESRFTIQCILGEFYSGRIHVHKKQMTAEDFRSKDADPSTRMLSLAGPGSKSTSTGPDPRPNPTLSLSVSSSPVKRAWSALQVQGGGGGGGGVGGGCEYLPAVHWKYVTLISKTGLIARRLPWISKENLDSGLLSSL